MRSGPPEWSQMKPNTNSVSSAVPENQAPHIYCYKGTTLTLKGVNMLQPKYLSHAAPPPNPFRHKNLGDYD